MAGWMGTRIRVVNEEIGVKGQPAQKLELKFTRHGPIFHRRARQCVCATERASGAEPRPISPACDLRAPETAASSGRGDF